MAPAVVAAIIALLTPRIRGWFLYNRSEFNFDYNSAEGPPTWDIQWEDLRLTIEVKSVHNDHVKGARFVLNSKQPGQDVGDIAVSNKFQELFDGRFQIKLHSIIRTKIKLGTSGVSRYRLRWVALRRR
jgi:hypothetical protein